MTTALIDGDIIVYACGFANDIVYYTIGKRRLKYHKTAKKWCKDHGLSFDSIVKHHEPGDINKLFNETDKFIKYICKSVDATDYKVFLTGKDNYRNDIAVTHIYKGTRNREFIPYHKDELTSYLIAEYGAIVINGMEADDALGINQTDNTIICSTDKDLLTIPGWHYNFRTNLFTEVDEQTSWFNFYTQMLTGDKTDNIVGVHGVGPVTAKKILEPISHPQDMLCEVAWHYLKAFDDPESRMLENAQLLYIKRYEDDKWEWNKHEEI